MSISQAQIKTLLEMIATTRDQELSCDECLALMAEVVEARLRDELPSESTNAVIEHLDFCGECREEYETLKAAVLALGKEEA